MMKHILFTLALTLMLSSHLPVLCQTNLEAQVRKVLRNEHGTDDEGFDKKSRLEQVGSKAEVGTILLNLLEQNKYAQPGTEGYKYLIGATSLLGNLQVHEAAKPLSRIFSDRKINTSARAFALRSLGQIDAEANKRLLLTAMADPSADYLIRSFAAEALADTNDPQVLKAVERRIREEQNQTVRRKLEETAQKLRAKQ